MKFHKMLEDSGTLIEMIHGIVLTLSPKGEIVTFNSYLENISGYTSNEIRARKWFDLFTAADPRDSCQEFFQNVVLINDTSRYTNKIKNRDGTIRFFEWNLKPVRDTSGKISRILGVGQDISDRIANEGQLLQERFELVEKNKALACLYGIDKVVGNPEFSFHEKLQAITALIPNAFQYPEAASVRIRFCRQTFCTPEFKSSGNRISENITLHGEKHGLVEVIYPDQSKKYQDKELLFLMEEQELLKAVAQQLALIFERKEAEDRKKELETQVRHADRLATIGQLAAGIAHELNNPLGDILGFAQLAAKYPELPEQVHKDLERIAKSSMYAREIIKKILMFSRPMSPRKTRVNLNTLVEEWVGVVESQCSTKGVELSLVLEEKLPEIAGDPYQLNQVLVNLVNNAVDAMPEGGRLTIKTFAKKDSVYLVVQDTGIGMNCETFEKIFMPFFTTKDVDKGTGLGLSVAYGIVEAHGGSITADSTEGQGATFEIEIPLRHKDSGNHGQEKIQQSV